jgi:hypothetical protein
MQAPSPFPASVLRPPRTPATSPSARRGRPHPKKGSLIRQPSFRGVLWTDSRASAWEHRKRLSRWRWAGGRRRSGFTKRSGRQRSRGSRARAGFERWPRNGAQGGRLRATGGVAQDYWPQGAAWDPRAARESGLAAVVRAGGTRKRPGRRTTGASGRRTRQARSCARVAHHTTLMCGCARR